MLEIFSDPTRIIAYPDGKVKKVNTIAFSTTQFGNQELKCSEESEELQYFDIQEIESIKLAETHIPNYNYLRTK